MRSKLIYLLTNGLKQKGWNLEVFLSASLHACRLKTYQVTETKLKKCHSFFSLFSVYNVIQFLISFLVVVITRKLNLKVKFLFWQYKCRAKWLRGSLVSQTFKYNETKYNFFFFTEGYFVNILFTGKSGDYFSLESVMLGRYDMKLQNLN